MTSKEQFKRLKEATQEHLIDKRFVYRPRKVKMEGKGRNKKPLKDSNDNLVFIKNQFHPATYDKRILLSLAFNMALENYQNIRHPLTSVKKIKKLSNVSEMLIRYFSNKYYSDINDIGKSDLINKNQDYDYAKISQFRDVEYTLYGTVELLRNYYSHYIHEPGILSFTDLFMNTNGKTLKQDEFDVAKECFLKRFEDAKTHLIQSMKSRKEKLEKEKNKENDSKIEEIDNVIKMLERTHLLDEDGKLTINGQLFIATMFLTKRQAKIILDKWRGLKGRELEGYENTKHTFFTYYSLRERYSINNYNDNLLQFRNIISKLSTLPYSDNPQLRFIYDEIKKHNDEIYKKLDKLPNGFKQTIDNKKERKKYNDQLIPYRKRNVYTEILLQYIIDNNLLKNKEYNICNDNSSKNPCIKIAVAKTMTDKFEYIENAEELNNEENLTALKNRIKKVSNPELKAILREHLKELKRNFIFITPEEFIEAQKVKVQKVKVEENDEKIEKDIIIPPKDYKFYINKKNALIQYIAPDGSHSNIVLSQDLLMKWVLIHLEKNINVWDGINKYINFHNRTIKNAKSVETVLTAFTKNPTYKDYRISHFLPASLLEAAGEKKVDFKRRVKINIEERIKQLENFLAENKQHNKPWKFASKRKIDVILHYLHFKLLYDVYIDKIDLKGENVVDYIRHKMFHMDTYDIARHYFRFFGRYKRQTIGNLDIKAQDYNANLTTEQLKVAYKHLFDYIQDGIDSSDSLEDLFNWVISRQIDAFKSIQENFETFNFDDLLKVLKINHPSDKKHIESIFNKHYVQNFAIPHELINIKEYFKETYQEFLDKKEEALTKRKEKNTKYAKMDAEQQAEHYTFNYTVFSFIRDYLTQKDHPNTNIDFIFQKLLDKNKPIKSTVYNQLLKLKTEELVLWQIAKAYWKKANGDDYNTANLSSEKNTNFADFCSFNKVYRKDLKYKITIGADFWKENKGKNITKFDYAYKKLQNGKKELTFTINVPAKKYDNKFLSVETKLIKEYVLWYHLDDILKNNKLREDFEHTDFRNVKFNLNNYEDLIKLVYKELIQSVTDIFQILRAEKRIVDDNIDKILPLLDKKYKDRKDIDTFYLTITDKDVIDKKLYEQLIKRIPHYFDRDKKDIVKQYLVSYRNYALHYQLQDPDRKKIVLEFLSKINKNDDKKNEFYTYPAKLDS